MEKEGRDRDETECIEVWGGLGAGKEESDQVQEERGGMLEVGAKDGSE